MTVSDEQERARKAAWARSRGLEPWQADMADAIPENVMRDVVADSRAGISRSASMIPERPDEPPPRKPSGGTVEVTPPNGINHVDAIAESFARRDRAVTHQQAMELAWIEKLIDRRSPSARARMAYDPLERYDSEVPAAHRAKDE